MSEVKNSLRDDLVVKKIDNAYMGYLVGKLKEVLEASISNEYQLRALKSIMADRVYEWWEKAGFAYLDCDAIESQIKGNVTEPIGTTFTGNSDSIKL